MLTALPNFSKVSWLQPSRHPPPPQNAVTTGEEGWPPPSLLPTSISHRALVVYLMSLDPVPSSLLLIPHLLHPCFCFGVLLYFFCLFMCFFSFFAVSVDLLRAGFIALHPLLSFFRAPTAMSFHCALLCTGSMYTRSISFPVFLFACIQLCCFSFPCISFVICL
jgi:hypothetical protein